MQELNAMNLFWSIWYPTAWKEDDNCPHFLMMLYGLARKIHSQTLDDNIGSEKCDMTHEED